MLTPTTPPDADALSALLAAATPGLDDFGPDVRETCAACKCLLMPPDAVSHCEDCHPDDEQADAWRDALEAAEKRDAALRNAATSLIAALRERDALAAERDEARDWVRKLTRANVVTCVYCGHAYEPGTPTHGAEALTEHVAKCEKHPMRGVERERDGAVAHVIKMHAESGELLESLNEYVRQSMHLNPGRRRGIDGIRAARDDARDWLRERKLPRAE